MTDEATSEPEEQFAEDEVGDGSSFLENIVFITGEDPNAGSFLLTVGIITCVFVAAFQLTLPEPISNLLTAAVLVVAVISFLLGAILDMLDYFDTPKPGQ
ncbi:hypothetical protein [Natranaeroarchaeum aerophilus]|uniref:Uncharacterized protein n=1 Tax=Natranaeroarchaeum aerophilus TaxID=2917711 RepID=A0AAE3K7M3_9EURY|nr:hypothetical protein [Natranaeroarchaeum aerophilus]MCL9814064.1 hypothetical protein [Natranaeroarchaeum aerophilus]